MRKLVIPVIASLALILAAPAVAGQYTYYKIKGGSLSLKVNAANTLDSQYGIDMGKTVGPLSLKKGGSVYDSNDTLTADVKNSQSFTIKYDTRGADGKKAGVTTLTVKRIGLTIGTRKSFLVGHVSGSSTVPGVTVTGGEFKIFNIDGGKVKKSKSKKYKYTFSSGKVTFNSQVTNLLNTFGTPMGNDKASAKVDLGHVSVKIK